MRLLFLHVPHEYAPSIHSHPCILCLFYCIPPSSRCLPRSSLFFSLPSIFSLLTWLCFTVTVVLRFCCYVLLFEPWIMHMLPYILHPSSHPTQSLVVAGSARPSQVCYWLVFGRFVPNEQPQKSVVWFFHWRVGSIIISHAQQDIQDWMWPHQRGVDVDNMMVLNTADKQRPVCISLLHAIGLFRELVFTLFMESDLDWASGPLARLMYRAGEPPEHHKTRDRGAQIPILMSGIHIY